MENLLYDFKSPETFRVAWSSENARLYYQPRIQSLSQSFQEAEFQTVLDRKRKGGVFLTSFDDLMFNSHYSVRLRENNLSAMILGFVPRSDTYSNEATPATDMNNAQARILITNSSERYEDIGEILGYPDCCIKFFKRIWEEKGYRDTIPFQYRPAKSHHPYCNIMLKGLGIRAVPHLPCSPYCKKTIEFAKIFLSCMRKEECQFLEDLLSMEVEYSSYHGYAEVKTNYFKLLFNSVAFKEKFVIKVRETSLISLTTDNGFPNQYSQDSAHGWLLNHVKEVAHSGSLVDLGCGNGALLASLSLNPKLRLSGVDNSLDKCKKAQELLGSKVQIDCKNIFLYDCVKKDYILVAEQRFQENPDLIHKLDGIVLQYNYSTNDFKVIDNRREHDSERTQTIGLQAN